jgi:hypothetical protein
MKLQGKVKYVGTGLAFIGIGITLMVALPPPWWPRMPPPLVHIGVIVGALLTVVGTIITVFGMWPVLPNPKIPLLGMGTAVVIFGVCALWFWVVPDKSFTLEIAKPLKRLIAYSLTLATQWNGKNPLMHGYNIRVDNVSSDTITARIIFIRAEVDGTPALIAGQGTPVIIPQTQGSTFQAALNEDAIISLEAKAITVEFEINYDTIPESGVRRSYRKLTYPLNWANGKTSAPLLEPKTIDEWEKYNIAIAIELYVRMMVK